MGVALASVKNKIDGARMLRIVHELVSECQDLLVPEGCMQGSEIQYARLAGGGIR